VRRMESALSQLEDGHAGQAWLDALPRELRDEAQAALRVLPATAAAAGRDLPLVTAAWLAAEPERAAALLDEWLATMDSPGGMEPFCPVVCQWVEWAASARADGAAWTERRLDAQVRCVQQEAERADPRGTGWPAWHSAQEALLPGAAPAGTSTVDIAVLISNEAAALLRLTEGREGPHGNALDDIEGEQREVDGWLRDALWDEEESAFRRADAADQLDPSPCGWFALGWSGRTEAMAEGLRARVAAAERTGWTPRGWLLLFALLLRTPHRSVLARMRAQGLPEDASETERAVWTVLTAEAEAAARRAGVPRAVRWIDRHGLRLALGVGIAGAVLLAGLLGWAAYHRNSQGPRDLRELERAARAASAEGRHGQAAALYGQAARRGPAPYFLYRQAGEWLRMGEAAAAEQAYRDLLADRPEAPNVRLNLALAVWRQGRRAEALELYRAFAEDPRAAETPDLAARARLATELIEQQMSLDGEIVREPAD